VSEARGRAASRRRYDTVELLRPRVDACVFRFLKSRPLDRKEFIETGSQVSLAPKTARQVALRALAEVPASDGLHSAFLAGCNLSKSARCQPTDTLKRTRKSFSIGESQNKVGGDQYRAVGRDLAEPSPFCFEGTTIPPCGKDDACLRTISPNSPRSISKCWCMACSKRSGVAG